MTKLNQQRTIAVADMKFVFLVLLASVATVTMYVIIRSEVDLQGTQDNVGETFNMPKKNTLVKPRIQPKPPVILFWTDFFSNAEWGIKVGKTKYLSECNVTCEITNVKLRFNESKAIIIHPRNPVSPLPSPRQPWQYVVFFLLESPVHTPNLNRFAGMFNYTMTYRPDSDIPVPYGRFIKRHRPRTLLNTHNSFKNRTKDILWLVSNCSPPSRRQEVVAHLKKNMKVDIFGGCGKAPCNKDCEEQLTGQYKFYLAFENSLCDDYVTEKLFKTYEPYGLIPIVYGGANYSKILPPNSFINVADYRSIEEMSRYIHKVSVNETLFNSYFEWKQNYFFTKGIKENIYMTSFCQLCNKLHQGNLNCKTYGNIQKWWAVGKCRSPNQQFPQLKMFN